MMFMSLIISWWRNSSRFLCECHRLWIRWIRMRVTEKWKTQSSPNHENHHTHTRTVLIDDDEWREHGSSWSKYPKTCLLRMNLFQKRRMFQCYYSWMMFVRKFLEISVIVDWSSSSIQTILSFFYSNQKYHNSISFSALSQQCLRIHGARSWNEFDLDDAHLNCVDIIIHRLRKPHTHSHTHTWAYIHRLRDS